MENIAVNKRNKSFGHRCRKLLSELGMFLILLVLPIVTIWISLYHLQNILLEKAQEKSLDEMAEMTAHMLRLSEPESYYQEAIRKMADSFRWAENIEDVARISTSENLELALFDSNGKRLEWPVGENLQKIRSSEQYLSVLKRVAANPENVLTKDEENKCGVYSGNSMTVKTIAANPNTLINFQGIGLSKMGSWFKVYFSKRNEEGKFIEGDLLAWLHLNKLEKYSLANKAINTMQRLTSPDYTFSYIDLNNQTEMKVSRGREFINHLEKFLASNSLKSGFIYKNELFSINDTSNGLRLICSKPSPEPLPLIANFNRLLYILIPTILLFFIWKKAFKVSINLPVKLQSVLIFGFAAITGITAILISTVFYQYEKQVTITQNYKNKAIETLEKVDKQYSNSFSDLILQYQHFNKLLKEGKTPPEQVLAPLIKAYNNELVAFAIYVDKYGKTVFQAPASISKSKSTKIADKYAKLIKRVAVQTLDTFNSSRSVVPELPQASTISAMSSTAVEGLLAGRSSFINIKLDEDEMVGYCELVLDKNDLAQGCLLITHDPQTLENRYLRETGKTLLKSTGFELIAFPKKVSNQKAYFPRFSYINEEPLWKLNDMLNQTQLPSFKEGKLQEDNVIVAAIPGSNMINYNLFLAMPAETVADAPFSLSNIFMLGLAVSLILIVVLSTILINSITSPVKILTENALAIQQDSAMQKNQITFSDNNELESISTGLTNLVVKVKEFQENKNSCENLFKSASFINGNYELSSFISQADYDNKSLSYISKLDDNLTYMFVARVDNADNLTASLPLTMYAMALKLFIEQLNMRSPLACIRNLEEYFRINLRRNLDGSGFVAFIDTAANKIEYAGFGKIKVLKTSFTEKKCDILSFPNGANFIKGVKEQGDTTLELSEGDSLITITEPFAELKLEALRQMLESSSDFTSDFSQALETNVRNLTKAESSSCSVAFVHRKELTEEQHLKKKLAENNPIALIRSQKTGSQTNV